MNTRLYSTVKCPAFMGYNYKDNQNQDQMISV
jgi:hypothetical protein